MKRINRIILLTIGLILVGLTNFAFADENLTGDQVKALFTDKTFDGESLRKNKNYRVFSSANGSMEIIYSSGKTKTRYWQVDDKGRHCVAKREGSKGRCSVVVNTGDGTYKKLTDDEHTHNMKNFTDGNNL
jgi:hypothetical protein